MGYTVTWCIDLNADSPEAVAALAREMHCGRDSLATHYTVVNEDNEPMKVDLAEEAMRNSKENSMRQFVCVPMEEGRVQEVRVFTTEEKAKEFENAWLKNFGLEVEKDRLHASDWGTGIAIWECEVDEDLRGDENINV